MLRPVYSSRFKKDIALAKKRGKQFDEFEKVVSLLLSGAQLPPKNKDHVLTGNWKPRRECHLGPDWLLVYIRDIRNGIVLFDRTGTHADLFG